MTLTNQTPFKFVGYSLDTLLAIAGHSPAYLYDRAAIAQRIEKTRNALPADVRLHYSLKANAMPALVSHIATLVDGLDVASHGELRTALASGIAPDRLSFSGPGKQDAELAAAIATGTLIHLESAGELDRACAVADRVGATPRLSIRINPDFVAKRSGMVMGGGSQPFGVDRNEVAQLLIEIQDRGLTCEGLHCYAGSQILLADVLIALHANIIDMMRDIARDAETEPLAMNLGGGFGIPYFTNEQSLEIGRVGEALGERLITLEKELCVSEVNVELGRYLVGEAGIYVATVVERKVSRGVQYLVVDGGLNHHLAATGNLGQAIRRNYPMVSSRASEDVGEEIVTVVGPLCTPLDVLAKDINLPRLRIGDRIAVLQSGAYGYSASPHGFLSHPPPVELLL